MDYNMGEMKLTKKQKALLRIAAWVFSVLIVLLVSINLVLGWMLETKLNAFLKSGEDKKFEVAVEKARVNILTGTLKLKGVSVEPDSAYMAKFKARKTHQGLLFSLHIPVFKLVNFQWRSLMKNREINVNSIVFDKPDIRLYARSKEKQKVDKVKELEDEEKRLSIDSIQLNNVNGIQLGAVVFKDCNFSIYDVDKEEVTIENNNFSFKYEGFHFEEIKGSEDYFHLNLDDASLEISNEKFKLPGGWYALGFGQLQLTSDVDAILLHDFYFKPQYKNLFKMSANRPFREAIMDIEVDSVYLYFSDFRASITKGRFIFDKIEVAGLNMKVLMDKHRPENFDKRPKLPQQALKSMSLPLHIEKLELRNSHLTYQERGEKTDKLMTVKLEQLHADIFHATSIPDSIALNKPLTIHLKADFNNKSPLNLKFILPLNSPVDTFYFNGSLGKADMRVFNSAVVPAIGVEFEKGVLDKLVFSANASPKASSGQMTMLYHDLEAKVIAKKEKKDEDKFLSWVANSVVKKSNPGKNGVVRTVAMSFERIPYRGFGNIAWKTLQSGIVNTVSPVGKSHEAQEKRKEKKKNRAKKKASRKARK